MLEKFKGDSRILSSLKILAKLSELKDVTVKQNFGASGLIELMLDYLNSNENLIGLSEDEVIKTRTYGL